MESMSKNKLILYASLVLVFIYLLGRTAQSYFGLIFTGFSFMAPYFIFGFLFNYVWMACICILIYLFYEKRKNAMDIESKAIITGIVGIGAFGLMTAVYARMGLNMLHRIPEFQTIFFDEINRGLMDEGIAVVVDSVSFSSLGIILLIGIIFALFVAGILFIWGIFSKNLKRILIACCAFGFMILLAIAFGFDFIYSNQWLQELIRIEINTFR